jgi:tetratricopeptide (TPR) repeat protein
VYNEGGARIYQVNGIPPSYVEPEPYNFVADELRPANPVGSEPAAALPDPQPLVEEGAGDTPATPADLASLEDQAAAAPGDASAAYALAQAYRDAERLGDAAAVLEAAALANPDDVGLHHLWGDILSEAGRFAEAEQVYRQVAERMPTAGNWNKLGRSLLQWGDHEGAEAALTTAIATDDTAPEPYFRLGEAYLEQGRRDEAQDAFESYLRIAPPDHYLRNEAETLLNDLEE